MRDKLKNCIINDWFTPTIRAEVILDTLLTPYVAEIVNRQCGLDTVFLTKEMSILNKNRQDDRGEKIDYLLADEKAVYLLELKTTDTSINPRQAEKYLQNCHGKSFREALGQKLLDLVSKRTHTALDSGAKDEALLRALFEKICVGVEGANCTDRAEKLLRQKKWGSTRKYLYTMGQLLDYLDGKPGRTLWELPLRLLYLTPSGNKAHRDLLNHPEFYLHPKDKKSVSLQAAAADLKQGDELACLLAEIIEEIYGGI